MRLHRHVETPRQHHPSSLGYTFKLRPTPGHHRIHTTSTVRSIPTVLVGGMSGTVSVTSSATATLPTSSPAVIDYRPLDRPIRDQKQEGCCSGFAYTDFRALQHARTNGKPLAFDLSPAWFYWHERNLEHQDDKDGGACLGDGATVLMHIGCGLEQDMPYKAGDYATPPSPQADQGAADWRISTMFPIQPTADIISAILPAGPVVIGIQCYQSFENVGPDGLLSLPDTNKEGYLGGHALLIVGRDDVHKQFIVRNSWGTGFGDHGYCYMPYEYTRYVDDCFAGAE